MEEEFKSKYDFNIISSKDKPINDITKNNNITNSLQQANSTSKAKTGNFNQSSSITSLVEFDINKKYTSLKKKSPHEILILKLKCYAKLFTLTYNNYYTKDFSILRDCIYSGTTIYFLATGSIYYFLYFNPIKNSFITIAFLSYLAYVYLSWKRNIDEIIYKESLDESANYQLGVEVKEVLNDIALYNPFSKVYI